MKSIRFGMLASSLITCLSLNPFLTRAQPNIDYLSPFLHYMFGADHGFTVRYHFVPHKDFTNAANWQASGFGIKTKGRDIHIYANNAVSQQYATFYLLEQHFSCHYLSAGDFGYADHNPPGSDSLILENNPLPEAVIPTLLSYPRPDHISDSLWKAGRRQLGELSRKGLPAATTEQIPAFAYREINYGEARRGKFALWNGLSIMPGEESTEKHPGWGLWVHTMHKLIPPEKYFDAHPEYFALRNGVRLADQVCLSNPDVLVIVAANLAKEMEKMPEARYWSVSQMDNYQYCQCERCSRVDDEEGSHSGSIIRFVNALARRFPDKHISTLAYQYSRSAPKMTKPLPNVNIMLCSIECDRAKPIKGDSFEKDLAGWSALTRNIIIWDYVINFHHYLMPFPNWPTLAPNLRTFDEYGVPMVFEQGYNSPASEFQPLRNWMLSKLLWNPHADPDSLMDVFLNAYYGPAAGHVRRLIQTQTDLLLQSGNPLTIYEPPITQVRGYLGPKHLAEYRDILGQAAAACAGERIFIHRINILRQYLNYTTIEIAKYHDGMSPPLFISSERPLEQDSCKLAESINPVYSNMLDELVSMSREYGPSLVREVYLTPDEYAEQTRLFWQRANADHLARSTKLMYLSLPDKAYFAGADPSIQPFTWLSDQPLLDGKRGWLVYQTRWQGWWGRDADLLIDLGAERIVSSVTINFLENNQSWIVGPSELSVHLGNINPINPSVSGNVDWNSWATVGAGTANPDVGKQLPEGIHTLTCELRMPLIARYIHVRVGNPGMLPKWRGVEGMGWLFIDEVEVR